MQSVGEIVRKAESDWRTGTVTKSKHVKFNPLETLNKIDAYLNSTHTTGQYDSRSRKKPFFNIVTAQANIWQRATDIDTNKIKFRGDNSKSWLNAIIAKIFVRKWMRKERFPQFLNDWGRVLSRYGSAVVEGIENSSGLHLSVLGWFTIIIDARQFGPNPKIKVLELTEAQLLERVTTMKYNKDAVDSLIKEGAENTRHIMEGAQTDTKPGYYRLYEVHMTLSREILKKARKQDTIDADKYEFFPQVHVISMIGKKDTSGKDEWKDFTIYAGIEKEGVHKITHLIEEDDRSIAVGAVENAFTAQWMVNESVKAEKDAIEIGSRLAMQTADESLTGQNVLDDFMSGDIFVHRPNMPLAKVDLAKPDIQSISGQREAWRGLAREINGISEAMLGIAPKSGTPASQTIAILRENYSLFELMTENKGLAVIDFFRDWILPYIKTKLLNNTDEIGEELENEDIERIDAVFLKDAAIKKANRQMFDEINKNLDRIAAGKSIEPIDMGGMMQANLDQMQESLKLMGNTRYFKPSEITNAMWAEQLKDFGWDMEIDVTGEESDIQEAYAAMTDALSLVMNPAYETNEDAKMIVRKMLALKGAVSPTQLSHRASPALPQTVPSARPSLQPLTASPATQ